MKQFKTLPLVLALLLTQLAGAQTNPLIRHLPENASMVMAINPFRIGSKIPKDSLLNSPLMKMAGKDEKDSPLEVFNKLSTSGINLGQDILIAFANDTKSDTKQTGVHVIGKLSNEMLFGKMIQEMFPNDSFHTYGTDKICTIKGGTLAWNNDVFIFSSASSHQKDLEVSFFSADDTTATDKTVQSPEQLLSTLRKQQREDIFRLLDATAASGLAADPRFTELMSTPADMKVWNAGGPNPFLQKLSPLVNMAKMGPGEARVRAGITNFENGKVISESRMYMPPSIAEQLSNYVPQPQQTDLIKKIPAGTPLLIMSAGFNKNAARNMKQPEQLKLVMDSLKKIVPFDWEKLADVFGSNMLLAITMDDHPDMTDTKNPFNGMHFYLAMPIADKGKFDELAAVVNKTIDSLRATEDKGKMLKNFKPVAKATKDLFVLGFREEDVTNFMNNPGTGTVPEWIQQNASHPMVMQFDFKPLIALMMQAQKGRNNEAQQTMFNSFRDIVIAGGEAERGAIKMRMEYRFSNPEQNALLQLFNMMGMMATDRMEHASARDAEISRDEAVKEELPPPPPPKNKPKTTVKPKTKTKN